MLPPPSVLVDALPLLSGHTVLVQRRIRALGINAGQLGWEVVGVHSCRQIVVQEIWLAQGRIQIHLSRHLVQVLFVQVVCRLIN